MTRTPALVLGAALLAALSIGCGDDGEAPLVPSPGDPNEGPPTGQTTGGSGGGGGTGGNGASAGSGGFGGTGAFGGFGGSAGVGGFAGGGIPSRACVALPAEGNTFLPVFNDTVGDFDASFAFSAWLPDRCDPFRQLSLGFNEELCSTERGQRIQVVIPDSETFRVIPGVPYDIRPIRVVSLPVTIRLQDRGRIWGNCEGSTGFLNFRDFGTELGDTIRFVLDGTLTDCSDFPDDSTVTVDGTELTVSAPPACLR